MHVSVETVLQETASWYFSITSVQVVGDPVTVHCATWFVIPWFRASTKTFDRPVALCRKRGLGLLLETGWKSDERRRAHYTWN